MSTSVLDAPKPIAHNVSSLDSRYDPGSGSSCTEPYNSTMCSVREDYVSTVSMLGFRAWFPVRMGTSSLILIRPDHSHIDVDAAAAFDATGSGDSV